MISEPKPSPAGHRLLKRDLRGGDGRPQRLGGGDQAFQGRFVLMEGNSQCSVDW